MTPETGADRFEPTTAEATIIRILSAPRDLVFASFVEPERIAHWFGPEGFTVPIAESDASVGGAIKIVMRGPDGIDYPMTGNYRELEPPSRLVVETQALGSNGEHLIRGVSTIDFVDLGDDRTEVVLHATATALVPEAMMMIGGMEAGWSQSLQGLEDILTGATDRQMMTTRIFQAPRELVFQVFTEAEHVAQWWGPTGFTLTTSEMDVRPGGRWEFVMRGPDGTDYPNTIVYDEVTPPLRLLFTHGPEPEFKVTITFDSFAGSTIVGWRMAFDSAEARDKNIEEAGAIEGSTQTMNRLEAHLAALVAAG